MAAESSASAGRTRARNRFPASVSDTLRVVRWKSRMPSRFSRVVLFGVFELTPEARVREQFEVNVLGVMNVVGSATGPGCHRRAGRQTHLAQARPTSGASLFTRAAREYWP